MWRRTAGHGGFQPVPDLSLVSYCLNNRIKPAFLAPGSLGFGTKNVVCLDLSRAKGGSERRELTGEQYQISLL